MINKIFKYQIPFYAVALFLVLFAAGVLAWSYAFHQTFSPRELGVSSDKIPGTSFEYGSWPALSDPNFFQSVHQKFVDSKTSFIEADLSAMKLRVYKDGVQQGEFAILTIGREGSWWETPAGLYKIETKEKNHFSSFGHVYQPWSMAFQGNFFIHGWPYEPNGTPVASTYSGGCIRLSTDDAKIIYDMMDIGTPVIVYKKAFDADAFQYHTAGPVVSSSAYLAADMKNNFVFASVSSTAVFPIASLTKLMTALVATEYINLDKSVTITPDMLVKTSKPRLRAGESYTAYQLLYPLLQESSNEAATALADSLGSDRFVSLMNEKAKALGMNDTHFYDPAGVNEANVSSAEDLFRLSKYLYNNRSFILKLSAGHIASSVYEAPDFPNLQNFNVFENDPEFVGGKVGDSTSAKETIVSIFDHHFGGDVRPVVIIVLGSDNNAADANALLSYVKFSYSNTQ